MNESVFDSTLEFPGTSVHHLLLLRGDHVMLRRLEGIGADHELLLRLVLDVGLVGTSPLISKTRNT